MSGRHVQLSSANTIILPAENLELILRESWQHAVGLPILRVTVENNTVDLLLLILRERLVRLRDDCASLTVILSAKDFGGLCSKSYL